SPSAFGQRATSSAQGGNATTAIEARIAAKRRRVRRAIARLSLFILEFEQRYAETPGADASKMSARCAVPHSGLEAALPASSYSERALKARLSATARA